MTALRGRWSAGAGRATLALVALAWGCAGPSLRSYESDPGPYDRLTASQLHEVRRAHDAVLAGELEPARRILARLSRELPQNLAVATLRQDVEMAMLEADLYVPGLALGEQHVDPGVRLSRLYGERVLADPGPADLVLAARLEPSSERAIELLDRAIELDPDCVWAHHGRAWVLSRLGRFDEAGRSLEAAFDLDPGHMPARRLEAALLARSGERELAVEAHEAWLRDAADDPRVDPRRAADVRLDLATLYVQREEPAAALDLLAQVDPALPARPAALELVRAAALEELGDLRGALEAAQRAAELDPSDVMPLVHLALLYGQRFDEPERERETWERVLEILGEKGPETPAGVDPAAREMAALLIRVQARARLARLGEPAVARSEP